MRLSCIDLNADLGEGAGNDVAILPLISSVNIACGLHAGDPATMLDLVQLAKTHNVSIGAHPGYADHEHFGRREMRLSEREIHALVLYQLGALHAICIAENIPLHHVKPHGALYNQAAKDPAIAASVLEAIKSFDPRLRVYGLSGSLFLEMAKARGLKTVAEVFADRSYAPDGSLTPRSEAHALLEDPAAITAQVLGFVQRQSVRTSSGADIALEVDSICLHGDGPHALGFAQTIHQVLSEAGIQIKAPL
jgi:UPF0271 protein